MCYSRGWKTTAQGEGHLTLDRVWTPGEIQVPLEIMGTPQGLVPTP